MLMPVWQFRSAQLRLRKVGKLQTSSVLASGYGGGR